MADIIDLTDDAVVLPAPKRARTDGDAAFAATLAAAAPAGTEDTSGDAVMAAALAAREEAARAPALDSTGDAAMAAALAAQDSTADAAMAAALAAQEEAARVPDSAADLAMAAVLAAAPGPAADAAMAAALVVQQDCDAASAALALRLGSASAAAPAAAIPRRGRVVRRRASMSKSNTGLVGAVRDMLPTADLVDPQVAACCLPRKQNTKYTCGHENLAALLRAASAQLPGGLEGLGDLGEDAIHGLVVAGWNKGFDPEGKAYYGGTFAGKRGSQRWIGPTEAYVACCHLGLKLVIAEWEKGKDGGAHGDAIYQHARRHFAGPDKGPIYHQRDGHSVTIFGTTADASAFGVPGTALLVCDPNVREGTLLAVGPATLDGRDHMLAYTVWNSAGERRLLRAGEAALEPVGVAA